MGRLLEYSGSQAPVFAMLSFVGVWGNFMGLVLVWPSACTTSLRETPMNAQLMTFLAFGNSL